MAELRHFLRLLGKRGLWLVAGSLLMLMTSLASFGLLALSGWFITATGLAGLALAAGARLTLDIYRPGAGIRFFAVGRAVTRYAERVINHEAVLRILADLRLWLFRNLLQVQPGELTRFRDGELLNRITADINTLDHLYLRVLGPTVAAALGLTLVLAFMFWVSPAQAVAAACVLLPTALAVPWLTHRAARPLGAAGAERASALRERLIGDLQAQAELHVHGAVPGRLSALAQANASYLAGEQRLLEQRALADGAVMLAGLLALWLALAIGTALADGPGLSGPVMAAMVMGLLAMGELLAPLPLAYQLLGRVQWSARRLLALSRADRPPTATPSGALPADTQLVFTGVRFGHRAGQRACVDGLNLRLGPGERIGILGPSGSGKSTLLRLAIGDLLPDRGEISLGGVPLDGIDTDRRQSYTAYMDQRATLFAATIATNLRLGRTEADDTLLWEALAAVALDEAVRRLPDGLQTWLGEGGTGLSGGQARRLVLARTLLKPAPIVLLDEPTEGLDERTERRVLAGMEGLLAERSLIVISHQVHRFPRVDRILRLDHGRLVPQ